jgi:hypothetical protein
MKLNAEKCSLNIANEVTTSSDSGVEEQSELLLPPNQVAIDGLGTRNNWFVPYAKKRRRSLSIDDNAESI